LLKRVGFDRNIKLEWLDKTAQLLILGENEKNIKNMLDSCLTEEIKGKESRRKSINILMRSWVNVKEEHKVRQEKALTLYEEGNSMEGLALHWCMVTQAYELFFDISEIIGKLLNLQNEFSLITVRRRVYETWGERSTLYYAIDRVLRSMKDWGVIEPNAKPGEYKQTDKIKIESKEVQLLLLETYLAASQRMNVFYAELEMVNALFPFMIDITLNDIQNYENLKISNMGMELVVGL
jgi:hypothetical protein